jgi:F-type H+-transporting ATPase subunit epsilon
VNLKLLLPSQVFAQYSDVTRIVAETPHGSFGILPHRLDCVAALAPGILEYATASGTAYFAIAEGVLIKNGVDVLVSVRRAIGGGDLAELNAEVKRQFLAQDSITQEIRSSLNKFESSLVGRLAEFLHER